MHLLLQSDKNPFVFSFNASGSQNIKISAYDYERPLTKYTERIVELNGARSFQLQFPLSPERMMVEVTGQNESSLKCYGGKISDVPDCGVWIDAKARRFITFAQWFAVKASYLPIHMYRLESGEFKIKYQDTIRGDKGQQMTTPARIGHESGIIEVARDKFLPLTVPSRLVILFHEYSHKYMNPQIGLSIEDETAADIMGLYMYLGLGFPHIDAREVFANVFYSARTKQNEDRLNLIEAFITRFEKGEIIKGCK